MASTGDAALGEAEAGSTKKNRRRISDYLGDSDGGELETSLPSPETPPQLRLPRFTCARFVRLGRKRGGRKEVAEAVRSEDASVDTSGAKQAETSAPTAEAGMGVSMLLLLATTCVELNRMAEVRAQMETLLNEIRDEASRVKASADHVVGTPGTCCNLQPSSTTVSSSCTSDTDTNRHATTSSCAEEIARQEDESKPGEEGHLEAELETEHAQHRLLECSNTDQETSESSDDEFIELEGGRFGGGGSGGLEWDVGDEDSEEESTGTPDQDGGVCAIELERRLHELLHRRNRERIEELESALRRAEQKLREKEMEAQMWQETVTLALQQPPPPGDGQ